MPDPTIDTPAADTDQPEPESSDDLGEKGEKALDAWKQRAKAAEAEAKRARGLETRLKEFEDRDKSESEKLAERAAAAEKTAAEAQTGYLRLKVATAKGLPANLAERLRGTTEEEMTADADELLSVFKPKSKSPSFDGGARGGSAPSGSGSFLSDAIRKRNG